MQKIPTLYLRDPATHYVTDQVNPGCEWVLAGEGFPTRKYNGTYELIGPMINGNPDRATAHRLERHTVAETIGVLDEGGASVANPDPADVIALCREWGWEGTVWHHPDGRMAKLKVRDYPPRDGAA